MTARRAHSAQEPHWKNLFENSRQEEA